MREYLDSLILNPTLLTICLITTFLGGMAFMALISSIRNAIRYRRWERAEEKAEKDAGRIMSGLRPDKYQTSVDNGVYFDHITDGKGYKFTETEEIRPRSPEVVGYKLKEGWRQLVEESQPRSPEIVAEAAYRDITWIHKPVRVELNRSWPQWTDEQRAIPGRHRKPEALTDWERRALETPTGSMKQLDRRELARV